MADRVAVHTILDTPQQLAVHVVCVSDGTGETDVIKVDKSTLLAVDGQEPDALEIEMATGQVNGFTNVTIESDRADDDLRLSLGPGSFYFDFTFAGVVKDLGSTGGLLDPRSPGGTGDLILTTTGAAPGDTYDITILCRKAAA